MDKQQIDIPDLINKLEYVYHTLRPYYFTCSVVSPFILEKLQHVIIHLESVEKGRLSH